MKEKGTINWYGPNTDATNETGFTAIACGRRNSKGAFINIDDIGNWWSSTEYSASSALYRNISCSDSSVGSPDL